MDLVARMKEASFIYRPQEKKSRQSRCVSMWPSLCFSLLARVICLSSVIELSLSFMTVVTRERGSG